MEPTNDNEDDWLRFMHSLLVWVPIGSLILIGTAKLTYWAFFGGAQ